MWVDTRECVPIADGTYYVQTVYGDVTAMQYTYEGGWNTHYDNGKLYDKYAMNSGYVARWHKVDYPPAVPQAWKEEYYRKEIE